MIDLIFEILVLKSIGSALLLVVVFVTRPFVLKWMNARVAYSLWLMIPVYLLLPVNFVEISSTAGVMTFFLGTNNLPIDLVADDFLSENLLAIYSLGIWGIGLIATLILFMVRYRKLLSSLNPVDIVKVKECQQLLSSKRLKQLELVHSSLIDVPAVFGLFQSHLILPSNFFELPISNQKMILNHELYHLERHDHRINFVRVVIKSLFWFNPIFYFADKYCEADQEMSCDLGVLQSSETVDQQQYARALLESVSDNSQNNLISQWKYQSLIKERVKMLNNIKSKKWHSWVAGVFAASAIWMTSGVVMAEKEEIKGSDAIPTNIVQPRYPRKAALEGVEGWVKLRFDLDEKGSPLNLKVVNSMPEGVFVDVSIKAVKQWKFKVDGSKENLVYTLEYEMPEGWEKKIKNNK